jgi:hypothetical protein
MDWEKN